MSRKTGHGEDTNTEKEDVLVPKPGATAPLLVRFGLRSNSKGEPSHVEVASWKISPKNMPFKSANTTNLQSTDPPSTAIRNIS